MKRAPQPGADVEVFGVMGTFMSGIYENGINACAKVASMKSKMMKSSNAAPQPVQRVMRDPSLEQLLE